MPKASIRVTSDFHFDSLQRYRRSQRGSKRTTNDVPADVVARMITRLVLMVFILCGCASAPPQRSADQHRAEQVARLYAVQALGLSKSQVARIKADHNGFSVVDGQETIQFYDPNVFHPNSDGLFEALTGGFPSYFRITVDIRKWQVINHYGSRE
jgi:hypothetical protein